MADLLTRFADHLGLTPDEAAPALDAALAAMRRALDSDGTVAIEGVGTFGSDGRFEADHGLLAAINGEYAGLETFAEPAPVAVPFVTSFPVVPAEPAAPPPFAAFATGRPDDSRSPDDTIEADLADVMDRTWVPPPSPPVASLDSPSMAPPAEDARHTTVFPTIAAGAPFAATATPEEGRGTVREARAGRSPLWWAVPVTLVAALAVWWLAQRDDGATTDEVVEGPRATGAYRDASPLAAGGAPADSAGGDSGRAAAATAEPPAGVPADAAPTTPPPPVAAEPTPTRAAPEREPSTPRAPTRPRRTRAHPAPPPAAVPSPPPTTTTANGAWGVYGSGTVEPTAGGVTWILNSTDASEAAQQVEHYRELGFRSSVLTAVVDGRRVNRVAVGQFADVEQARAARSLLPPDAPADTWILRLGRTP